MTIRTINPITEEIIQEYNNATKESIGNRRKNAKSEYYDWIKDTCKRVSIQNLAQQIDENSYDNKSTILKNVIIKMNNSPEEVFGPALSLIRAIDENESADISNDTWYSLEANMWAEDSDRAKKLSNIIQSGSISVNDIVVPDPKVRIRRIKQSNIGSELPRYGMLEFVNMKKVRDYDQSVH